MTSKDIKILNTFTDHQMRIDLTKLLSNCKDVEQFKRIKRIGEGI